MVEFLSAFHFLRPWWLLAAAVPLAGCFRFFAGMKNVSAWESVCDRKLLDFLLVRGSSRQRSLTAGLLLAGMLGDRRDGRSQLAEKGNSGFYAGKSGYVSFEPFFRHG